MEENKELEQREENSVIQEVPINITNNEVVDQTVVEQPKLEETPIQPTIEPQIIEEKSEIENQIPENNLESQNNNSNKKSNKSSILLIILFILLFAFVLGMPYVNEFLDNIKKDTGLSEIEQQAKNIEKEQEKENALKDKKTEEKIETLDCTSPTNNFEGYNSVIVESFEYNSKNQVLSSSKTTTYTFVEQNENYASYKDKCDNDSLKYLNRQGYTMSCSYSDTEVVIGDEFNLEVFMPIVDGDVTITANANYLENVNLLKNRLIENGYTCKLKGEIK